MAKENNTLSFIISNVRRTKKVVIPVGLLFIALAGCHSEKLVATVGDATITETDFLDRASRIPGESIPAGMDSGTATMVSMLREIMTNQLAKTKNGAPTEDEVKALTDYQVKLDAKYQVAIDKGQLTREDLLRSFRYSLCEFGIGTEGAKIDDKKVLEEYNKYKDQAPTIPNPASSSGQTNNPVKRAAVYIVRMLQLPNEAAAKQALEQLQKTGDFRRVARALSSDPQLIETAGRELFLPKEFVSRQLPALETALAKLSDGQFTPAPVIVSSPTQGNPTVTQNIFIVGQLVKKEPDLTLTLQEAAPGLRLRLMESTHPDWRTHKDQEMAKYTKGLLDSNKLDIKVDRLKTVKDTFVRTMAESFQATAPGGTLNGGSAPPAGAGR